MKEPRKITRDTSDIPVLSVALRGVFRAALKVLAEQSTGRWLQNLTAAPFPRGGAGKAAALSPHRYEHRANV